MVSIDAYLIEYPGAGASSITDDAAIAVRAEKNGATVKRIRGDWAAGSSEVSAIGWQAGMGSKETDYKRGRREALEEAAKLLDPENFPLTDGYRIMASTLAERAAAIRALAEPHPKR